MNKEKLEAIKNFIAKEFDFNPNKEEKLEAVEIQKFLQASIHLIGFGAALLKSVSFNKDLTNTNKKMIDEIIKMSGF